LPVAARLPLLAAAMLSLLTGLWGGLGRLGYEFPPPRAVPIAFHGPIMVSAFLGTLIGLERAVGIGRRWAFGAPLAAALGALALATLPMPAPAWLFAASGLGLLAILIESVRLQPGFASVTIAVAAACWPAGNVLYAIGRPIPEVVSWWIAFLGLTIAGERLELTRFLDPGPRARALFASASGVLLAGALVSSFAPDPGVRMLGAGCIALACWLATYDIAKKNARRDGLLRFTAVCLLSGYVWLAVSGIIAVAAGVNSAGPLYDAWLHAFFVGFVLSMVFGHAPIIFPAVLARAVPFRGRFWAHLALLHATLLLRIASDLAGFSPGVRLGGLGNVLAVLLFVVSTIAAVLGAIVRGSGAPPATG
jgi:hypothetical protein